MHFYDLNFLTLIFRVALINRVLNVFIFFLKDCVVIHLEEEDGPVGVEQEQRREKDFTYRDIWLQVSPIRLVSKLPDVHEKYWHRN